MNKAQEYNSSILGELLNEITPKEAEKTKKRMLLAARIDDAIKAKGWRKIDFAKALNKQPSEITKWLSGTHNFNTDTLFDIEEVLETKLIATDEPPKEQVVLFHFSVKQKQTESNPGLLYPWTPVVTNQTIYKSVSHISLSQSNIKNCQLQA